MKILSLVVAAPATAFRFERTPVLARRLQRGVLLVAVAASLITAPAQEPGLADARISPTLYFASEAAELESRNALHVRVTTLEKELAAADPKAVPTLLNSAEEVLVALQRHSAYLRVRALEDTTDQVAKAAGEMVNTDWSVLNAAMRNRLARVPHEQISALGRYVRLASQVQENAAHSVPPDAARYRGAVILPAQADIAGAYDRVVRTISSQGVSSRDIAERRAALARRDEAYDRVASFTAALLAMLIDIQNRDAVAQGYADACDRKYHSLEFSDALVRQTLAATEAQAPIYREYERTLAEHAARTLGVSPVLPNEASLAGTPSPRIPQSQARQLILDALQPLGPDYTRRFATLLDPANGRLDLTGGKHRARTGTSIVAYDAPVSLFFTGYDGSLTSLSTIAHEGGHAIHRELMNGGGAPVYERNGPHYLFEGFAILNEILVLDHAARIAKTPAEHTAALEGLLSKLCFELFVSAEETAFERRLYTAGNHQELLDRAAIDRIYRQSIAPFEYWPIDEVAVSRAWMRKSLLFEDPLYLVNYLYAQVVAVALWDKLQTDREFASHYERLLRRGFDADAETLLHSLDIRLDDPELVNAAARFIRTKTEELQKVYEADAAAK